MMKNEKVVKVVATGILVAGLITSFGGSVLASSKSTSGNTGVVNIAAGNAIVYSITNGAAKQSTLKEALAELVTAGTITQDQSDAVLTYFQQNLPQKPITAPVDGVNKFRQGPMVKMVDPLKDLVDKGTITQDQAGKILTFLEANDQKMQSMLDRTDDMSQEQRTQYLKENLGNIKDPVSRMFDQGIITQQQADAVRGAVTGSSGVVTNDGSLGSGLPGGQMFFFSSTASDESQN